MIHWVSSTFWNKKSDWKKFGRFLIPKFNLWIGIIMPGNLVWCVKLAGSVNHPVISLIHQCYTITFTLINWFVTRLISSIEWFFTLIYPLVTVMSHKINENLPWNWFLSWRLSAPLYGTSIQNWLLSISTLLYSFQLSIIATIHSIYESCNRETS